MTKKKREVKPRSSGRSKRIDYARLNDCEEKKDYLIDKAAPIVRLKVQGKKKLEKKRGAEKKSDKLLMSKNIWNNFLRLLRKRGADWDLYKKSQKGNSRGRKKKTKGNAQKAAIPLVQNMQRVYQHLKKNISEEEVHPKGNVDQMIISNGGTKLGVSEEDFVILVSTYREAVREAKRISNLPKKSQSRTKRQTKRDLTHVVTVFKRNVKKQCTKYGVEFGGVGRKILKSRSGDRIALPFVVGSTKPLQKMMTSRDVMQSFRLAVGHDPTEHQDFPPETKCPPSQEELHKQFTSHLLEINPCPYIQIGSILKMRENGILVTGLPSQYDQNKPVSAQKRSILKKCLRNSSLSRIKITCLKDESIEISLDNTIKIISTTAENITRTINKKENAKLLHRVTKLRACANEIEEIKKKYSSFL